jgi:hypothetical protein
MISSCGSQSSRRVYCLIYRDAYLGRVEVHTLPEDFHVLLRTHVPFHISNEACRILLESFLVLQQLLALFKRLLKIPRGL